MKISLSWLSRYVSLEGVSAQELCDRMVMSGFEVEDIEDLSATMQNVVVGRIVKLERHPDADRLQVCTLDVGGAGTIQIVTGATNVFEGAVVPVALHDSLLPNGTRIKKGKLRGVVSEGMLCSGQELCITEEEFAGAGVDGIWILPEETTVGADMRGLLGLDDVIVDFKITANRPDCQSVLGVAREAAVALRRAFHMPEPVYPTAGAGSVDDCIQVENRAFDLCPRYLGRVVRNLRVAPSPVWMQKCLKAAGMRPINNIVDITNFVMLETGQPMHAFDLADVAGGRIVVRRAAEGEQVTTLDGKAHTLTGEMLVIADGEKPACIAGIMGGQESEIEETTRELFLEAAKFRRDSVRRTARTLGVRTESSGRFERGVDIHGVAYAMERALQLIAELDAGDIVEGTIDLHEGLPQERVIVADTERITGLLGVSVPPETMADILNRLGLPTTLAGGELVTRVPSRRDDVEGMADLAEEIIRVYGYDHIVGTPMRGAVMRGRLTPERAADDRVKTALVAQGAREIATYSFIAAKEAERLRLPSDDDRHNGAALLNPLGEEYAVMRTQLYSSMLTALATNANRRAPGARLFEISKVFFPAGEGVSETPTLALGLYGGGEDFFTLKGLVEHTLAVFGVCASFARGAEPFLHPGRQAVATLKGQPKGHCVATLGEVHPAVAAAYGLEGLRVYVAQVDMAALYRVEVPAVICRELPRYPAVERDVALLCGEELPVGTLEETMRGAGGKLLESARLFDVYRGAQVGEGNKSVAYRLVFRSAEGTLTDEQVDAAVAKLVRRLGEVGASVRQ